MTPTTAKATRRSDADVFSDARHALDECPSVPAGVRVHVDHGVVTLTGIARWASERAEAEDVVRHVRGVQRIVNDITVSQAPNARGFEPPDDPR